ncbi:MAG: hypothetical protein ACRDJH_06735 [Thermomicrobiales bacterium]
MDSVMKGLFGGGKFESEEKANQAKDFVNRYEEGDPTEGFSSEEAIAHYRQVAKDASPETMQRATQKAVERLNPSQREDFAKMLKERQQGQVERREGDSGGGAGLDDLLGSLMGGSASGQAGGGGIGDLFGSLMGGGDSDRGTTQATASGGAGGFDVGDILGSNVGKAVLGGIAAFAMKEILDNK